MRLIKKLHISNLKETWWKIWKTITISAEMHRKFVIVNKTDSNRISNKRNSACLERTFEGCMSIRGLENWGNWKENKTETRMKKNRETRRKVKLEGKWNYKENRTETRRKIKRKLKENKTETIRKIKRKL
jgi:hypothetical protein